MNISANPAIASALESGKLAAPTAKPGDKGNDFAQMLMDVIKEVDSTQNKAESLQQDLITNRRPVEYHDVMIAMEKANTAMQLTLSVRNKLLDAYQEIERLQV